MTTIAEALDRLRAKMEEDGTRFSKCANCGTIYPLGPEDNETTCGERCTSAYIAYLNSPEAFG